MERLVRTVALGAAVSTYMVSVSHAIFAESPADEPPRYCTVFTHFVKSGGSTVKKQLIQHSLREGSHRPGQITGDSRTTPASRSDALHNAPVIVGPSEIVREPLKAMGRDCEYFTMMRDPIDRLVSAFYYCPTDHDRQGRPSKWCGDSQGEKEPIQDRLLEYAEELWGNKAFSVMLGSILCEPAFEYCDDEHARAEDLKPHNVNTMEGWLLLNDVKHILATYTAVGIFEERELSMELFDAKVKSPVREWDAGLQVNAGSRSAEREELRNWAHTSAELHNTLAADILLYNYGVALFRQQTRITLGVEWT